MTATVKQILSDVIESANVNGTQVLCRRVKTGMTTRLDAVTFPAEKQASAAAKQLMSRGVYCDPVLIGRTWYLAVK